MSIDQIGLREIVFNLISNGLEAAGAGGTVRLTFRNDSDSLVIEVVDSGPGFSVEQQSRLFEPFFTTKHCGTGLGLYVVARRVRELGGRIECESIPHQSTMFQVKLPRNVPTADSDRR
jgi:signal transduction histidine kinase